MTTLRGFGARVQTVALSAARARMAVMGARDRIDDLVADAGLYDGSMLPYAAVDKAKVLHRLTVDNPAFHYAREDQIRRVMAAGFDMTAGECNLAPSAEVLRWIAGRVTADMITIETGAGQTTVLFAALAKHHYCCTEAAEEIERIRTYMEGIGIPSGNVTFLLGSSDVALPQLKIGERFDFAFIDGCHGYPFPAMDWHHIDKLLRVGGLLGMDNVELRPVREHCEFLEENGSYERIATITAEGYFVRFYEKLRDEHREWVDQEYSRSKRDR